MINSHIYSKLGSGRLFVNQIINLILTLVVVVLFFACSDDNLLRPFGPGDDAAPGVLTNVTYTALAGGAKFNYVLPPDNDLSYVKAEYYVNGVKKSAISSQYNTTLTVEGLPEKKEYNVDLYCVDKSGNVSKPTRVTILPEESPVKVMRESLKCTADFGGFRIDYENPSKSELSIYFLKGDTVSGKLVFYQARVFSQAKGTYQVVGLPNLTNKFGVFVRDRFGNTSSTLEFEDKPWREEYLDKSKFKYVGAPKVVDNDDWYSWMGRPQNLWDDIVGEWNFAQTGADGKYPHYFCIDLGDTVPIGRILFQQRLGNGNVFNYDCIRHFEVYGALELPAVNYANPLEGWTKLNDKTFEVIRPSGRKPGEPATTEDIEAAEKGIMFTIDTPYPRPEIRYLRFKFLDSFNQSNMALAGEFSFWAQWK
ncbi:MAG: DUF4959 domain-containing protein [Bacteroidota bacterium]|nr:DUF4959 domain-containing protein [Bacteroidota bacterium]